MADQRTSRNPSSAPVGRDAGRGAGREFGRDGVSGLVTRDRMVRAREVSRPSPELREEARSVVEALVERAQGRRR